MRSVYKRAFVLLVFALLLGSFSLQASSPALAAQEEMDVETIIKIREEVMNNSQAMDHLSWLADVYGPRLSGSPQIEQAKDWTMAKVEEWGLENSHEERFDFGQGWEVVRFNALSPEVMSRVVDKFVREVQDQLAERKVELELTPAARDWLARKGYDPAFGARPMARMIQVELKDRLADDLLFGPLAKGGHVVADVGDDDRLSFRADG